ncbi:MAG: nucleotide exchange factor GrpE [Pseudomonadota bacterium]
MSGEKTTKQVSEDEVTETPEESSEGAAPEAKVAGNDKTPSVEDLVPGLEDAIQQEHSLEERLAAATAELTAERDEYKDRMMRALAEAENVRRRAERDQRDAQTYGGTRLARDLLTVYDNLARALDAADDSLRESHASFLEGVELTQRELVNAFAKHKIEAVVPEPGDKFDPNRHQAMFEAPLPGAENGSIIEVMQAGFVIADRLLRPALVGVAKAAQEPAEEAPADAVDDGNEPPAES